MSTTNSPRVQREEHTKYHVLVGVERLSAHKCDKTLYMSQSEGVMVIHVGLLKLSSKFNIVQKKTLEKKILQVTNNSFKFVKNSVNMI